ASTQEPATTDEPASTQEPATTDEPASTQEPATTDEPASTQEPATTEEPLTTEEPSSSECSATSSISPMTIDSSSTPKNYDLSAPLSVPCSSDSFNASFQVSSDSDVFIAIADKGGFYSNNGVIEAQIGLLSGRNSVRRGRYSTKRSSIYDKSKRDILATINVTYSNSVLSISVGGKKIISYSLSNFDISQLYISSSTGSLSVTSGSLSCDAPDFCSS
ncbi:300 kDa antigen, partial [Smittium mucronatum]